MHGRTGIQTQIQHKENMCKGYSKRHKINNKGPAQGIRCARAAQLVPEIMQKTRVGGRRTACPYDNSYKSVKQINKQKLISHGHLFGTNTLQCDVFSVLGPSGWPQGPKRFPKGRPEGPQKGPQNDQKSSFFLLFFGRAAKMGPGRVREAPGPQKYVK